jgi:hypothetical protein
MATVISILHPSPYPLQGEAGLVLSLTFKQPTEGSEEQGYRMVARAEETGRVLGRWVSDCALTATETALLWCSKSLDEQGDPLWSLAMGVDSLDWQRVLDTVTDYQPGEHPQVPPRQVVSILAGNFPAVIPQPPRRGLPGPTVRRPGQPIERAEAPAAPPAQRPQRPQRALPAPQPEPEPAPTRARTPERVKVEVGEEEQELSAMVREMYRALKSGTASAEEVRAAMLQIAGPDEDEDEDEDEDDLTTWDDEGVDEDEDGDEEESDAEDEDEDEDESDEDEEEDAEDAAPSDEGASLEWDKGMRLYGADQRAYDKLALTQQRALEIQQRVRAHLEAQAAAEAHAAQQAAAEAAAVAQQAEPAKPRRNLRRLAEAVVEAQPPAHEPAPEPAVEAEQEPIKRRRTKKSA